MQSQTSTVRRMGREPDATRSKAARKRTRTRREARAAKLANR